MRLLVFRTAVPLRSGAGAAAGVAAGAGAGSGSRPLSRPLSRSMSRPRARPPLCAARSFSGARAAAAPAPAGPPSVARLLAWQPAAAVPDVAVRGHVRSVRSMKTHVFVTLGDGSSLAPLQAVVPAALAGVDGLANGAAVLLTGAWTPSPAAGQSHELQVATVTVLGPSDAKTFPIQKKYQSPEFLRTLPHLRSRLPFSSTLLRLRSEAIAALGRFFDRRGFLQTHPPLITSSDCEGAGEVFAVVGGHAATAEPPFFRAPKYLTVSTQLHLEALAQSVGNVWTLSPTFRAEPSDTPRHLSEFYMLEAELAWAEDLGHVMDLAEDLLRAVAADLRGSRVYEELVAAAAAAAAAKSHKKDTDLPDLPRRWDGLLGPAWPRITYAEAVRLLAAAPVRFKHALTGDGGLQTEHERYLAQTVGAGTTPVFVTHYPRAGKAFYMLPSGTRASDAEASETVDCFDLLVPEFCEIAGGSMREHRLDDLVTTMRARGMRVGHQPPSPDSGDLDWYVDLRRWGCPPHGGFGIGFDRLLCYLSGVSTIRDTVAFPRWFGRCDC